MLIIGCDFHSGFQQIAIFDNQTGEIGAKALMPASQAKYALTTGDVVIDRMTP